MMFRVLFALLSTCFCLEIAAQDYIDLAKLHYTTTPTNNFDSIDGNTSVTEIGADITLPIKLNDKNAIITGFYWESLKVKLFPLSNNTTFSTINVKLGLNKKHSQKWSGTYLFLPKISSDLEEVSAKGFQFGGLVLMKYSKKDNFKYNIGLYYNKELFGSFFVPILGFYYKSPNKKFEANVSLPVWADVNYKLTHWFSIGSNFSSSVKSYYLTNNDAYVVKKTNETYGYLQLKLKKSFLIQTKMGFSVGRSFKIYNQDDQVDLGLSAFRFGDDRTVLNPTFKDGLVFKVRLLYRFLIQ